MPIYDYYCEKCGAVKERLASLEEYEIQRHVPCEKCHILMKRKISFPAVVGKQTTGYNPNIEDASAGDRNAYESLRRMESRGKLTKKVFDAMNGKDLLKRKSELTQITPISKLGGGHD